MAKGEGLPAKAITNLRWPPFPSEEVIAMRPIGGILASFLPLFASIGCSLAVGCQDNSSKTGGKQESTGATDYRKVQDNRSINEKPIASWFNHAVFSPDGSRLLTIDTLGGFDVWDVRTNKQLWTGRPKDWQPITGQFFADGKRVLLAGSDKTVVIWDAEKYQTLDVLCAPASPRH